MTLSKESVGALSGAAGGDVKEAAARFEAAWRRGERPDLAALLPDAGPARLALLIELAHTELELRLKAGEAARAEEYLSRFPELAAAEHEFLRRFPDQRSQLEQVLTPPSVDPAATRYSDDPLATRYTNKPAAAARPAPPGYELLGELGRGGMGVVYQARQIGLNRVVALKMILAGAHAGPEDLARFRSEAEAIARLQHPNIVQIHEVGEHEGRPFFSMEFCPGGGLDKKLQGTPLPPQEAAALIETLARAVHAAHRRNVVHRDLKPANVLFAEDGTAKVTDFGLAKRLDADTLSRTGEVMGTPSYMPPEQASGHGGAVGPAADVYALGAILYECLTGRPPFKAATALDTLLQVLYDDPVPPRQLQSKTPRDLETICLKCLQKEPKKRYAGAEALAADLRRFRANEPIAARPVGPWGRTVKWVRRRPAVAAFMALFVVSLVAGTGVAWYLAGLAIDRADKYQKESDKNAALFQESQERMAEGFLRPLRADVAVDPNEIKAIWDLSRIPADLEPVRFLFVERAFDGPDNARKFWGRAPMVIRAAMGLDGGRRREMLKRLRPRLEAADPGGELRTAFAAAAAELAPPDAAYASEVSDAILDAMDKAPGAGTPLADSLSRVAGRLDESAARSAARKLLSAMDRAHDSGALLICVDGLCALAPHMNDAEARETTGEAARKVLDALAHTSDMNGLLFLPNAVGVLAPRMDEGAAHRAADEAAGRLLDAWGGGKDTWVFMVKGEGWYRIAPWLDVAGAKAAAPRLLAGVDGGFPPVIASQLADVFASIAPQLDEADSDAAGRRVVAAVEKTDDPDSLAVLADWFAAVAPRMSRAAANQAAAAVARKIVGKLVTAQGPGAGLFLAGALGRVAPYLDEREAETAAVAILGAMDKAPDPDTLATLAGAFGKPPMIAAGSGFGFMSPSLPGVSSRVVGPSPGGFDMRQLIGDTAGQPAGLGAVVLRMKDDAARKTASAAARKVFDALRAAGDSPDPALVRALTKALAALAPRLDEADADEAVGITLRMGLPRVQPGLFMDPFEPLRPLGPRMSRAAADAGGEKIAEAAAKNQPANAPYVLIGGFDAVAPRMSADAARAAARKIFEASNTDNLDAPMVEILASRMDEETAHRAAAAAAPSLVARFAGRGYFSLAQGGFSLSQADFPDAFRKVIARLHRQELVDLLKEPTCTGEAEEIILDRLGRSVNRKFIVVWDFVDWAEANDPSLDLHSPPSAPEPQVQPPVPPAFNPQAPG